MIRTALRLALAFIVCSSAWAEPLVEPFVRKEYCLLDGAGDTAGEQVPKRNPASNFVWCGFNAGSAGEVSFGSDVLQFVGAAAATNSRAVTRFDSRLVIESASDTENHSFASVYVDATQPDAKVTLEFRSNTVADLEMAILIRDRERWYESSAKPVPLTSPGKATHTLEFPLHNPGKVSWRSINMSKGCGADMDQVDAGGDNAAPVYDDAMGEAQPDLAVVVGMGVIIKSATAGTGSVGIGSMSVLGEKHAVPAAPAGLAAKVAEGQFLVDLDWQDVPQASAYHVYRAPSSYGPFTKISSNATLAASQFQDQVPSASHYIYVVRAVDENGVESEDASVAVTVFPLGAG